MKASTIVIGYDGSTDAEAALDEAISHVDDGGIVHVVTVHQPHTSAFRADELPEEFEFVVDPEASDRTRLGAAEQRLRAAGVRYETHLPWGHPAAEILDLAEEVDADLIVLGSRGLGGVERFLRGSVSSRIATHTDRSTLIIHRASSTAA